jgi:serine/threonine protein kinase
MSVGPGQAGHGEQGMDAPLPDDQEAGTLDDEWPTVSLPAFGSPAPGAPTVPVTAQEPAPADGRLIGGRYRLVAPIGQGSMGRVWYARDELLGRDVAVKEVRLPPGLSEADNDQVRQRILREARSAARLSHSAVATVHDVTEDLGHPWIVMELIHGRPLDQITAADGPLTPRAAARAGRQLLAALTAAHEAGVLHRDVKPGNVLLTTDGRAVLTDFGVAAIDGDPALTQSGMVLGTPAFSAPERIRGEPATPAGDLWSLGATLYAAVEGHGPYDRRGGATATIAAIVTDDPPPPQAAGPLTGAITALLSRDPAARPTAAAAMRMLSQVADAPAGTPARPAPGRPTRPRRRAMVTAAACLVVAASITAWALQHSTARPRALQTSSQALPANPATPSTSATAGQPTRPTAPPAARPRDQTATATLPVVKASPVQAPAPYHPPPPRRGTAGPGANLALGAIMTASGSTQKYVPANANDGNPSSYWESTDNAFPQWLDAQLSSTQTVRSIVLRVPPSSLWKARTQTISVLGSQNGTSWTTLKPSAGLDFTPANDNTVAVDLPASPVRYLRLYFTGNTDWPAGQISEFEIFSGQ